jgi:hypothetical protein
LGSGAKLVRLSVNFADEEEALFNNITSETVLFRIILLVVKASGAGLAQSV